MSIMMEVWGDYASFNRPEMKTERVSYDVMTPSAARGILEAVYWHPGMRWVIDRIYVLNPVKTTNIKRNEVKEKMSSQAARRAMKGEQVSLYLDAREKIQPRAALLLQDVRYIIEAHFVMTDQANQTDNPGKFQDIMKRRLKRGQCFHTPYLGTREFPAKFRLYDPQEKITTAYTGEIDLGYMLYDLDYNGDSGIEPMFFRAKLVDGILDVTKCEVKK